MRVAGSRGAPGWACLRCADEATEAEFAHEDSFPVQHASGRPPALRRLPPSALTRDRHTVVLRGRSAERRASVAGPLPLWMLEGGRAWVLDREPQMRGGHPVWIYRAS